MESVLTGSTVIGQYATTGGYAGTPKNPSLHNVSHSRSHSQSLRLFNMFHFKTIPTEYGPALEKDRYLNFMSFDPFQAATVKRQPGGSNMTPTTFTYTVDT